MGKSKEDEFYHSKARSPRPSVFHPQPQTTSNQPCTQVNWPPPPSDLDHHPIFSEGKGPSELGAIFLGGCCTMGFITFKPPFGRIFFLLFPSIEQANPRENALFKKQQLYPMFWKLQRWIYFQLFSFWVEQKSWHMMCVCVCLNI